MVIAIGSETTIVAPLSTDRAAALAAIDRLDAWGTTPLYDATLARARRDSAGEGTPGAGAVVGRHRSLQRHAAPPTWSISARRRDVLVYPVAIGVARPPVFAELAAATGGRSFFSRDPAALSATMTTIAQRAAISIPARLRAGARTRRRRAVVARDRGHASTSRQDVRVASARTAT